MDLRPAIVSTLTAALGLASTGCSSEAGRVLLEGAIEECGANAFARVAESRMGGTSPFIVDFKGTGPKQHSAGDCINTKVEGEGLQRPTMTFGHEFGPAIYTDPPVNPPTWNREGE